MARLTNKNKENQMLPTLRYLPQMPVTLKRTLISASWLLLLSPHLEAAVINQSVAYDYDAKGRVTKEIVEPANSTLCLTTVYTYDSFGNKASTTTRNCNGSVGSVPGVNSEAAAPAANTAPLITSSTSNANYGSNGRFEVTATNALNHGESKTWNSSSGNIASITGPNGLITSWTYDTLGRELTESRPEGVSSSKTYALCGSGVSCPTATNGVIPKYVVTDSQAGHATNKRYHDQLDRIIIIETQNKDGLAIYQQTEYDHLGRVFRTSNPYLSSAAPVWTTNTYDIKNRLLTKTEADGAVTNIAYAGLSTTTTNAKAQTRTEFRNSQDQLVKAVDVYNNQILYEYDGLGNTIKTTDSLGNITTATYDVRGRKTASSDPDQGNWIFAYDVLSQLKRQTNAKSQVVTLVYDKLGRVTQRNESDLISNFTYDTCDAQSNAGGKCIGKPVSETSDNANVRKYFYDSYGRLIAEDDNGYATVKNFDQYGRVGNTIYPGSFQVTHVYSATGYLTQIKNTNTQASYWQANTIDAEGRVTSETYGNNIVNARTYNPYNGRLTQHTSSPSGTPASIDSQSYNYDSIGNLTQRYNAVTGLNESFGYDNLNRITATSAQVGSLTTSVSLTYNAIGNIITKSDVGTYTYGNGTNANGQVIRPHAVTSILMNDGVTNYATYTYDANGNMLTGAGRTFVWKSWNMPGSIAGNLVGKSTPTGTTSSTFSFVYNAAHERVKQTLPNGTVILNLSPRVDAGVHVEIRTETDGTVETVNSLYAGNYPFGTYTTSTKNSVITTQTRYFHTDNLDSITAITNETGALVERRSYDAWGKRRNVNGTSYANAFVTPSERHGYTGHEELDEVGLIHMNGRIYDQAINRFTSVDPIIQFPDDMQSYNAYSYVMNNPFVATDPSGFAMGGGTGYCLDTDQCNPDVPSQSLPDQKPQMMDAVSVTAQREPVVASWDSFSISSHSLAVSSLHDVFEVGAYLPSVGATFMFADAGLYAIQGDYTNAGISLISGGAGLVGSAAPVRLALKLAQKKRNESKTGEATDKTSKAHGNSKLSEKSQHVYEVRDKRTGEVVKTGVSSGKISETGKSYRATNQVNKWGKDSYDSTIIAEIPAGPGARQQALAIERSNAEGLREAGQLRDRTFHIRP